MFKRLFCLTLTLGATAITFGASLVYEGFDYPAGPLLGQNSGSGFLNPWNADPGVLVQGPGLFTPLGLPSTGQAVGGGFNASRALSSSLSAPDYWASFMIQAAPGNDQVYLGFDLGASPFPLVSFGRLLNSYFIRQGSGPMVQGGIGSPSGVTDLLVAHLQQTGPGTLVSLWVNPTSFAVPPTVSMFVPTVSYTYVNMQVQPGFLADEIRIGETPLDVSAVPEPGLLGLLGLGTLGLIWGRRTSP